MLYYPFKILLFAGIIWKMSDNIFVGKTKKGERYLVEQRFD